MSLPALPLSLFYSLPALLVTVFSRPCVPCHPAGPAGKLVSDASIACGLAGWLGVAAVAVSARSPRLAGLLGLSSAAYCLGGGRMWRADPALVDTLKQAFHRVRPSEHHHTYAFPR